MRALKFGQFGFTRRTKGARAFLPVPDTPLRVPNPGSIATAYIPPMRRPRSQGEKSESTALGLEGGRGQGMPMLRSARRPRSGVWLIFVSPCARQSRQDSQFRVQCREVLECARFSAAFGLGQLREIQASRALRHRDFAFTLMEEKPCSNSAPPITAPGQISEGLVTRRSLPAEF